MIFDFSLSPFEHFNREFAKAESQGFKDVNAMTLATCTSDGKPSARTVLFKGMVRGGFSFYTNYESQKSLEIMENPSVALLFFWPSLDQQIRIQGVADKTTRAESEAYFKTRARISQLGAWASHQSEELSGHDELEDRVAEFDRKFSGQEVPCPPNWGGWRVQPLEMEFWFGQTGRLHDRWVYQREGVDELAWQTLMKYP